MMMNDEPPKVSQETRNSIKERREELEALADSDLPAAPIAEALLALAEL